MTHTLITVIAALGVAGQVIAGLVLLAALLGIAGVYGPIGVIRNALWGYELWAGFVVAAVATGGSLFFSDVAGFVPCELCWFQRICMYPLSGILLLAALAGEHRIARYLLPLPVFGAGTSIYHLLVENHVIAQTSQCLISAPGGCATKWIDKFGYMTIPTLALTGFILLIEFLVLASLGESGGAATLRRHA